MHSFAGIGLGKKPAAVLAAEVRRSRNSRERWKQARVLVLDEVSMVSGDLLDKVEYVARQVRGIPKPFGGVQIVLCGDFFQLPPVDKRSKFCFDAQCWRTAIHKSFRLSKVYRQRDQTFIDFLNAVRLGRVPPNARKLLGTLVVAVAVPLADLTDVL